MTHRRPRSTFGRYLGCFALGLVACDLESCLRGPPTVEDCSYFSTEYEAAIAGDGELLAEIPDKPNFPMALVISEEGVNKLLFGVTGSMVPFASALELGLGELRFTPTSDPVAKLVSEPGCHRCVDFSFDFSFELLNNGEQSQGAGIGSAALRIPLSLEPVAGEQDTTALVAHYEATVAGPPGINVMGVDTEEFPELDKALAILITEKLRAQYGPTEVIRFAPWTIGTESVKLAAREFAVFPDTGVMALGLQTNLDLPKAAAIEVGQALPQGVPMLVQMHPLLLFGMAQRMITEGVIPRRYNDDGQADPEGLQAVTLTSLEATALSDSDVDVEFRVWRTGGGYCGYANAVTTLTMAIEDDGINDRISVTPTDNLRVLDGEGVGELYEDNQQLVDDNKRLVDAFRQDLASQIGVTVNYSEISVEGANIVFDALALKVSDKSIDILLDFLVLDQADG